MFDQEDQNNSQRQEQDQYYNQGARPKTHSVITNEKSAKTDKKSAKTDKKREKVEMGDGIYHWSKEDSIEFRNLTITYSEGYDDHPVITEHLSTVEEVREAINKINSEPLNLRMHKGNIEKAQARKDKEIRELREREGELVAKEFERDSNYFAVTPSYDTPNPVPTSVSSGLLVEPIKSFVEGATNYSFANSSSTNPFVVSTSTNPFVETSCVNPFVVSTNPFEEHDHHYYNSPKEQDTSKVSPETNPTNSKQSTRRYKKTWF